MIMCIQVLERLGLNINEKLEVSKMLKREKGEVVRGV